MMNLSAPRLLTFVVSLVLAALALASLYTRIPTIGAWVSGHRFWLMVAAYVVLMLGVLMRAL
jgi:hypothetical protein